MSFCRAAAFGFGAFQLGFAQDLFLESRLGSLQVEEDPRWEEPPFSWGVDDESPLDTYVSKPDPNFGWFDTGQRLHMFSGAIGYVLNVTSQRWLDESRAYGPNGALWTHQALVMVPKELKITTKALIYLTGDCNDNPKNLTEKNLETDAIEAVSAEIGAIAVMLHQVPNCPIIYPSDPSRRPRTEDSMIAWAWKQFVETANSEWLPRLPMVKSAMQAMRAVEEFTSKEGLATISSWAVSGASKRGWTTWLVGAVKCETCPKVEVIAPIVPIVPDLRACVHHMWEAYGGFTFAFADYIAVNITEMIDDERLTDLLRIVDPIHYVERLALLPKIVVVSSDDEFMMMEWTRLWWDKFAGEKHLVILDNAEHSTFTAEFELIRSLVDILGAVFREVPRPSFDWRTNADAGQITVSIPQELVHGKVVLRHASTLSMERRDFRWFGLADNRTSKPKCHLPELGPLKVGADLVCIRPIIWTGITLSAKEPGVYVAQLPNPHFGAWTGGFVEVYFPADAGSSRREYRLTTTGTVFPNTMPFAPCHGTGCTGHLV